MAGITPIALSGLLAQAQRLTASASNVANARTTGALPDRQGEVAEGAPRPYQALTTQQTAVAGPDGRGQGTRAVIRPAHPGIVAELSPDSSFADASGLVAAPAVDLGAEAVDQVAALRSYEANLRTLKVADEMDREALDLAT
jgi:flagellar basal-body rod protein FlgC